MAHTPNVYIAAAYLAIKLLSLLAYCRGELRAKGCVYHLGTAKVDTVKKFAAKFTDLVRNIKV